MKIAFTGSHGTGKTTSMFNQAHISKIENPNLTVGVFYDNASLAPNGLFNKKSTNESQLWIFTNQMRNEIELSYIYDIIICDRTILDSVAYTGYMGYQRLYDKMFNLAIEHLSSYDMIYFKQIKHNEYWTKCKYRDIHDAEYRQRVEDILLNLYERAKISTLDKFKLI